MSEMRQAAIVIAASARLSARVAGMQPENERSKLLGHTVAYNESDFVGVIDDEGLGWNSVISTLNEATP